MAGIVYILCAILSLSCAILLYSGFRKNKFRLLFWSSIGFFGFAINNILLFVDLIMLPQTDLLILRTIPALVGMTIMVYGLVTDSV
jgi:hypothetical protein